MSPFPKYQRCLGVTPIDGVMEVKDRFVRLGFNVKLDKADEACLYDDFEKKQAPSVASFFQNLNLASLSEKTAGFNKLWERKQDRKKKDASSQ